MTTAFDRLEGNGVTRERLLGELAGWRDGNWLLRFLAIERVKVSVAAHRVLYIYFSGRAIVETHWQ